jgi:D-aminopeptidase
VNAAIEGAVAGGATEIVVNDSHSTMRNLPADALAGARPTSRGVARTGPRELRINGADPLAVYRSFCAAIMLTRTIAEAV